MKAFAKLFPVTKKVNNTTGYPHLSYHHAAGKVRADIKTNGQRHYIGIYDTIEEALAAQVRGYEKQLQASQQEVASLKAQNATLTTHVVELCKETEGMDNQLVQAQGDIEAFAQDVKTLANLVTELAQMVQQPEIQSLLLINGLVSGHTQATPEYIH